LPETCWACNKICNKYHLLHLVSILFPHNNDDAQSKSLQIFQHFMAFSDFTFAFLSLTKKVITTSSSFEWRCYVVFINVPSYRLQNFLFGEPETQLLHQLKFATIFLCFSKGRAMGRHCVWLFYLLFPLKCVNNVGVGILCSFAPRYSAICPLLPASLSHV